MLQTWILSPAHNCRNRSSRAELCSGPCPSYPCGNSSTSPLARSHFASPLAMNWSIMICARSEEHTSELQSLMRSSYAVFCLKKHNSHISKQHNTATVTHPPL